MTDAEEVRRLVELLRPFAMFAKVREPMWLGIPDDQLYFGQKVAEGHVYFRDFRAAQRAVADFDAESFASNTR